MVPLDNNIDVMLTHVERCILVETLPVGGGWYREGSREILAEGYGTGEPAATGDICNGVLGAFQQGPRMVQPVLGEPFTWCGPGDLGEHPGEVAVAHMRPFRHHSHRHLFRTSRS